MKSKISSVTLLILVASMIVGSIPNYVYADSHYDTLIRIATQARDQINIQLTRSGDIPAELQSKFDEGSAKIEFLIEAVSQNNDEAAKQNFLAAMQAFNEISRKISQQTTSETTTAARPSSNPTNEIDRLERYVDRLKEIIIKNNASYDFTNIDELIISARNDINNGDYEASNIKTEKIKQATIEINKILQDKTKQSTIDRIHFNIDQLENKLVQLSKSTTTNLEKAENMLSELKTLVSEKKLKDAIRMIHSLSHHLNQIENTAKIEEQKAAREKIEKEKDSREIKPQTKSLDDSKKDRIKLKIQKLETELNQLSEKVDNPAAKRWLKNAFSLLEEAKSQLAENPDGALDNIKKIEQFMKRIQNTTR